MSIKKHIPNTITSLSVVCGSLATILTITNADYMVVSALLIVVAAVFDFLDGMTARLLKAYSPMGKELDSLADMVSFGVAPAMIMYKLLVISITGHDVPIDLLTTAQAATALVAIIIVVFSGIRLAKFNVDTRQTESFIGLATPANALMIISLPLILHFHPTSFPATLAGNTYVLLGLTLFLSLMLVAEYPMFSFKFKNLSFAANKIRFIFLGIVIVLGVLLQFAAIPLIILIYIILSGINNYVSKA